MIERTQKDLYLDRLRRGFSKNQDLNGDRTTPLKTLISTN
jgi:hypothetical protein